MWSEVNKKYEFCILGTIFFSSSFFSSRKHCGSENTALLCKGSVEKTTHHIIMPKPIPIHYKFPTSGLWNNIPASLASSCRATLCCVYIYEVTIRWCTCRYTGLLLVGISENIVFANNLKCRSSLMHKFE